MQHKILFGYIILMAIITSMVAVLFHERNRVEAIKTEAVTIRQIRRDGNTILHLISVLAFHGGQPPSGRKSIWSNTGKLCLRTDSLLWTMHGTEFVRKGHIPVQRPRVLKERPAHLRATGNPSPYSHPVRKKAFPGGSGQRKLYICRPIRIPSTR